MYANIGVLHGGNELADPVDAIVCGVKFRLREEDSHEIVGADAPLGGIVLSPIKVSDCHAVGP